MIALKQKIEIDIAIERFKKNRHSQKAIFDLMQILENKKTQIYTIETLFKKIPNLSNEDFDNLQINESVMSGTTTMNIPNPVVTMQGASSGTEESIFEQDDEFLGNPVFDVDLDTYMAFRTGKNRYHRWEKYMNMDDGKNAKIAKYCKENYKTSVILRNNSGAMIYVRPDKNI